MVVDQRLQPLAAIRVEVGRDGYRQLQRFARRFPQASLAIEGAQDLGATLTARRVRMLSTGHGRKSDETDALSVGIAATTASHLNTAAIDEAIAALRALTQHRDDLVTTRTQIINRLHALLTQLLPAGLPRKLAADIAADSLRRIRPRTTLARTLRGLAAELITEIRRLDRRIATATTEIGSAVSESGSTLTALYGIGDLLAAKSSPTPARSAGSGSRPRSPRFAA